MHALARKLTLIVTGILILATLLIYSYKIYTDHNYTDFNVYYNAAQKIKQGNFDLIYDLNSNNRSPFRYPPPTLILFRPFAELSLKASQVVWFYLQILFFGGGFYFLFLTLQQFVSNKKQALWITCLSLLFIFRLCLDTFMIGQTSSLLFLCYAMGLYFWIQNKAGLAGTSLFIPAIFKVSPGILYGLFLCRGKKERTQALLAPLASFTVLNGLLFLLIPSPWSAWKKWGNGILHEASYFDASHYGSQSLKSALLRLSQHGLFTESGALIVFHSLAILICLAILSLWFFRKPETPRTKGIYFCFGLFACFWFMPETFKYSQTVLAFPVAFLLSGVMESREGWSKQNKMAVFSFLFGVCTISLAGFDLIGQKAFFWLQENSLPFLASVFLAIALLKEALRDSKPISFFKNRVPTPCAWEKLPERESSCQLSVLIPLSFKEDSLLDSELLKKSVQELSGFLSEHTQGSFEIISKPYGRPYEKENGYGSALRSGILNSHGKYLLVLNPEQPCTLDFYKNALVELEKGIDLVRGNRRLPETEFRVPVKLLPLIYQRHQLGLLFNRLLRFFLPIKTTDTHSGNLAFNRSFALKCFSLGSREDFLFLSEISLILKSHSLKSVELPLFLKLEAEKSKKRIFKEVFIILKGVISLSLRYKKGYYKPLTYPKGMTADDWGLSPAVNRGILDLAQKKMIRRVSLLAGSQFLETGLSELCAVPGVELGLHFNLTYGKPLSLMPRFFSPRRLLWIYLAGFGNKKREQQTLVLEELRTQIEKLKSLHLKISYLDGHHHIHLLPGLMKLISPVLKENQIQTVRLPYDPSLWLTRKFPILILSLLSKRTLDREGFKKAPSFYYPREGIFRDLGKLRARLNHHLDSEIIVHPADSNDFSLLEYPDPYTDGRVLEYQALRMLTV